MAIKIKTLEQISKTYTEQQYIYKDLALDMKEGIITSTGFSEAVNGTDIEASFDTAAIRNSLQNLFNTLPGQRFLFPEYGLDLYQYLFYPVTETTGQTISRAILRGIEKYEPRVRTLQVSVVPNIDELTYNVTIVLQLPIFKTPVTFNALLNTKTQSFIFVPTSRTS